jgi:hypothetical protein
VTGTTPTRRAASSTVSRASQAATAASTDAGRTARFGAADAGARGLPHAVEVRTAAADSTRRSVATV